MDEKLLAHTLAQHTQATTFAPRPYDHNLRTLHISTFPHEKKVQEL